MNTPNALFLLGLVFLTFACFSILRVQNTNNAKLVLQHISSLIKQNIKPKYFYEIGDSCIQIVAYITEDSFSLFLEDVLKQQGYKISNHSGYHKDNFSFFFGNNSHKHICEIDYVKNSRNSNRTFWITIR